MTYNPNIPEGDVSPATQQPELKTNFAQFASKFSLSSGGVVYNHTPFNVGNQGKHEAILMQDQGADPTITSNYDVLYNKGGQIFLKIPQFLPNGIPNFPQQLTFSSVNTAGPQYQSFLPGGYILYMGSSVKATPITLSPACSSIIMAMPVVNSGIVLYDVGVTFTQPNTITIISTLAPGGFSFNYIAIGAQ